jgi:hypothetical protein
MKNRPTINFSAGNTGWQRAVHLEVLVSHAGSLPPVPASPFRSLAREGLSPVGYPRNGSIVFSTAQWIIYALGERRIPREDRGSPASVAGCGGDAGPTGNEG